MKIRKISAISLLLAVSILFGCTQTPDETSAVTTDASTPAETTDAVTGAADPLYVIPDGANATELSVSGVKQVSGTEGKKCVYEYEKGSTAYALNEADATGKKVTLKEKTVSSVSAKFKFDEGTVAEYSARVQISAKKEIATWYTLYFGLRLTDSGGDATGKTGVWFALRESEIGIRTNNWPETTYMPIKEAGVDFKTERMLYITDDAANGEITVKADNDEGKTVTIAVIRISGDTVGLYQPGSSKPAVSDRGVNVDGTGYFNVWLHHMQTGPAYVSDLRAEGFIGGNKRTEAANMFNSKDVFADTWVSTDDEGRKTPEKTGGATDKKVGIFYFLWHDVSAHAGDGKIYDHSASYYSGGRDALIKTIADGPLGFAHYWAEPYFGYYRSDDEWVIRKHTYQLVDAGIDFIFIDATNGLTYEKAYETVLRVWTKMRQEGYKTPQICFHCGDDADIAPKSFSALWNNLYSSGRYEELWFRYDGKPLIFLPRSTYRKLPAEQKDFFTVRHSWAITTDNWYTSLNGKSCWPWADMYPQGEGRSESGEFEQMVVMSGFWVNGSYGTNAGRSYSYKNGGQPKDRNFGFDLVDQGTSGKGIAFEEQFDYAIEKDPGLIMLIGWNEWWAGRWEADAAGQRIANTYTVTNDKTWKRNYYVDNFNPEYSRDIEPVKGLYNDNYYYQMVQNVRDYKGARENQAAFGQKKIDITADRAQWNIVGPEFRDYAGDTAHRDAKSYVGGFTYKNDSGRNDFTVAKVSVEGGDAYFYAECADNITAAEGSNWMNLFINADCDHNTGWYGYDLVINRERDGGKCSVEKFVENSWKTEKAGEAEYAVSDNYIQIKVPVSLLGTGDTFDFKWADNSVDDGDIMKFIDMGDAAPNDRFDYRYTTKEAEIRLPSALTDDMTVLKAGSYYAFDGGKAVRLEPSSTKAVFFGDDSHAYVPYKFALDVMKLPAENEKTYNHYGVKYVDILPLLGNSGKTVTMTEEMIVISDNAPDADTLLSLYRALY